MQCIVSEFAGFCHGVQYTISSIEKLLENGNKDVFCIGLPVHNPQVTERLVEKGLHVVESLDDISSGTLVIRAHGLPPQIIAAAEFKGLSIVNTTCGFVLKAQTIARTLYDEGYNVLITGEREHPEVKTIYGATNNTAHICSSLADLPKFGKNEKIGVVSQTTFSEPLYKSIIKKIIDNPYAQLRSYNTLCNSIDKRIAAACTIASKVTTMIIVGGKMSSNTKRLYEACKRVNDASYHIETQKELVSDWFQKNGTVGITAGASTAQWIIDDITAAISLFY